MGGDPQSSQAMMQQMMGGGSPLPTQGFGQFGQEKMREMMRQMMSKNPVDPMPFGAPPTSTADMNKMMLMGYGQGSALTPPGNLPPRAQQNVVPLSI